MTSVVRFLRRPRLRASRINEPERAFRGVLRADVGEAAEQPAQFRVDDVKNMAAFLGPVE